MSETVDRIDKFNRGRLVDLQILYRGSIRRGPFQSAARNRLLSRYKTNMKIRKENETPSLKTWAKQDNPA